MKESVFLKLLSRKQKILYKKNLPRNRRNMGSVLSGTLKALPKVTELNCLPSCAICPLQGFIGDPMDVGSGYFSLDFCIALTTNRKRTFGNILGDKHREILFQEWWPWWFCSMKMSMIGRHAVGIRDGSVLQGLLEECAVPGESVHDQGRGSQTYCSLIQAALQDWTLKQVINSILVLDN